MKRSLSRLWPKGRVDDWSEVHREAHRLGYRTTATMMYGHLERPEDVVEHFEHTRARQDEALADGNAGFTAFIPWSFKRGDTPLSKRVKEEAGP